MRKPIRTTLAVSAALVAVSLTAPAATAATKLPAGCTFDGTTGTTTCKTSQVLDSHTDSWGYDSAGWYDSESTAGVFCLGMVPKTNLWMTNHVSLTTSTTLVTTTTYQGQATGKGNKPISQTQSTVKAITVTEGEIDCLEPGPFPGSGSRNIQYVGATYVLPN